MWILKSFQDIYHSGVGKLFHIMRWICPDILNYVLETVIFVIGDVEACMFAMKIIMN